MASILSHLTPTDIIAAGTACQKLKVLSEAPQLWRELFVASFLPRAADMPLLNNPKASPKALYRAR